jgi:glycerol-3-phosphate responsive antiterminator
MFFLIQSVFLLALYVIYENQNLIQDRKDKLISIQKFFLFDILSVKKTLNIENIQIQFIILHKLQIVCLFRM